MRVAVVSDTHGRSWLIKNMMKKMGVVDKIIHLGDYTSDVDKIRKYTDKEVISVRGNCDFTKSIPAEQVIEIGNVRIFITHGHNYGAKWGYDKLVNRAQEVGARWVLFGHTHVPGIYQQQGITLINPGSVAQPRGGSYTIAILEFRRGGLTPYILEI